MTTMLYQGHGSYRLVTDGEKIIYVDPFAGEGYDLPADLILVTHEHPDHNQVDKMPHADGCTVIRAADVHPEADKYVTVAAHGVRVTGVQAQNENHPADACVGMVIDVDDISFYASGDTSMTEDMRSGKLAGLGLDYAVFPADGFYNMDVSEAGECAKLVDARHSIPVHLVPVHDPDNATLFDADKAAAFTGPGKTVLEPGQELEL